jgi:hypothetical protein
VNGSETVAGDLMQGPEGQTASGEVPVDGGHPKRENLPGSTPTPLDPPDLGTQVVQHA